MPALYCDGHDAAFRRAHLARRGAEHPGRAGERALLRRDGGDGLRLHRPYPRGGGGRGRARPAQRALARVRGPAQPGRGRGPPRLGPGGGRRRARVAGAARRDPGRSAPRGSRHAGCRIPRVAFYLGRWIRGTDWYPDGALRLFDRTEGRAGREGLIHESVRVRGPVGRLRAGVRAPPLRRHRPTTCGRSTPTRRSGPARPTRPGAGRGPWRRWARRAGPSCGTRREGRLPPGRDGPDHLAPQHPLHPRQAGQARGSWCAPTGRGAVNVLHVDSAAGWRGGRTRCCSPREGMAARGHRVTLACQIGGRARGAGAATRASTCRGLPLRGDLSPARLGGADPAPAAHPARRPPSSTIPMRVAAGLLAARAAPPVRILATRRVDFPLRGRLSRWKYRSCRGVIAVSRKIADVLGAGRDSGGPDPRRLRGRARPPALAIPRAARRCGSWACRTAAPSWATWPR